MTMTSCTCRLKWSIRAPNKKNKKQKLPTSNIKCIVSRAQVGPKVVGNPNKKNIEAGSPVRISQFSHVLTPMKDTWQATNPKCRKITRQIPLLSIFCLSFFFASFSNIPTLTDLTYLSIKCVQIGRSELDGSGFGLKPRVS